MGFGNGVGVFEDILNNCSHKVGWQVVSEYGGNLPHGVGLWSSEKAISMFNA